MADCTVERGLVVDLDVGGVLRPRLANREDLLRLFNEIISLFLQLIGARLLLDCLSCSNLLALIQQLGLLGCGGSAGIERSGAFCLILGGDLYEGRRLVLLLLFLLLLLRLAVDLFDDIGALANLIGDALGLVDLGEALCKQGLNGAHLLCLLLLELYLLFLHSLEQCLSLFKLILCGSDGLADLGRL